MNRETATTEYRNNETNGNGNDTANGRAAILGAPAGAKRVLPSPLQGIALNKKRRRDGIELSADDYKMLSAIEVWGLLTLGQIIGLRLPVGAPEQEKTRLFFNEMDPKDYNRWGRFRANELREAGYIRQVSYGNSPSVFLLTLKGRAALEAKGLRKLKKMRWNISHTKLDHEVAVASVGLVLKESLGLAVRVDRVPYAAETASTKRKGIAVPDLSVDTSVGGRAVEIERTQKHWVDLHEKWPAFRKARPKTPLLYLTDFKFGRKFLLAQAAKLRADYVYVCGLEDFKRSCGRSGFLNYRTESLSLAEETA